LATGPVPFVISSNTVPPGSFLFFVCTIPILFYKIKVLLTSKDRRSLLLLCSSGENIAPQYYFRTQKTRINIFDPNPKAL